MPPIRSGAVRIRARSCSACRAAATMPSGPLVPAAASAADPRRASLFPHRCREGDPDRALPAPLPFDFTTSTRFVELSTFLAMSATLMPVLISSRIWALRVRAGQSVNRPRFAAAAAGVFLRCPRLRGLAMAALRRLNDGEHRLGAAEHDRVYLELLLVGLGLA